MKGFALGLALKQRRKPATRKLRIAFTYAMKSVSQLKLSDQINLLSKSIYYQINTRITRLHSNVWIVLILNT